jgi:hypothetical protein
VKLAVSNSETRIFCPDKKLLPATVDSESCPEGDPSGRVKIKELCGDVLLYIAQTRQLIDAVRAKKDRFRMETKKFCSGQGLIAGSAGRNGVPAKSPRREI